MRRLGATGRVPVPVDFVVSGIVDEGGLLRLTHERVGASRVGSLGRSR